MSQIFSGIYLACCDSIANTFLSPLPINSFAGPLLPAYQPAIVSRELGAVLRLAQGLKLWATKFERFHFVGLAHYTLAVPVNIEGEDVDIKAGVS
jgi:hypothetical protein